MRMTLTAHAVVGAGIVAAMPVHPILGLCAAFASHFVLDAIPHWGYPIHSPSLRPDIRAPLKFDRALFLDFVTMGSDALLGLVLAILLFATPSTFLLVLAGACAGEAPDTFHFFYTRYPHEPFLSIFRFHAWIQSEDIFRERPVLGIASQITFIAVFTGAVKLIVF
jgi:hypothetical protein